MSATPGADPLREILQARLGAQYEILGLLGQGGMGSVYRARDVTLHREVAIKVIGGDVTTNTALRDRFLQEARTVAKLRHPNIVAVYTAGDAGGLLYFVMELVPGESLRDLLAREGKVVPARAERILHELALALDYAHQSGIVHRDVKPENILLDRETGRAMLTDFGVARALEGDGRMTGTGMILGSPRYMSPEQASGESTLDGRSDLYALALVGYEMFTGKPVVESASIAGMLVKHLTEIPKPLQDAAEGVPEGTATAVDRALAKDRDQRWASGREMAEVIAMSWTPMGITPGGGLRTGVTATLRPTTARSPRRFLFIGGGALVAVAVSLWALFGRGDGADPRRSYAVMPFDIQTGNAEVQWLRDGSVNMLTLALSQWRDLSVVDYERTLVLVRDAGLEDKRVDLDRARDIARKAGAGTVVLGLISTTADSMVVDARLYDVRTGSALNRTTRPAPLGADPRPLFDELARYLLDVAGGSASASVELARATTNSLAAYRAYVDGVRLMNSWRNTEADSAFLVALAADSTFALAWHKRSLALGWANATDTGYVNSAQRALELMDRLPPREQALVRGHHALAMALSPQRLGDTSAAGFRNAQRIYTELLATDSLVAEGWYGLGDAYFHDTPTTGDLAFYTRRSTNAMRAFNRTLELDSTFHLAYSHLVQLYQGMAATQGGIVFDGDSSVALGSDQAVAAFGGAAAIARSRARAAERGLEISRGWLRADPDAVEPYQQLANSYILSSHPDSALMIMRRALARPRLDTPTMRLYTAAFQVIAEDTGALSTVRAALRRENEASIRAAPFNQRMQAMATAMLVAGASGNATEVRRVADAWERIDDQFPGTRAPMRPVLDWLSEGLLLGMGAPATAESRRRVVQGIRNIERQEGPIRMQMQLSSASVPFVAYLATRDTVFSNTVRRWTQGPVRHTDLDALEALARGDTAAARTIAAGFTSADSLRLARLGFAGLRAMARAEVLLAVGDTSKALAYYEGLDPARFNMGMADPGFAVYNRTFAARARIYADRGETAKAIAAWEEFLKRFANGDETVEPQRAEARAALRELRERRN